MKSFITYLKNVRGELQHVVWPKPRTAAMHTLIVILLSAFAALFIGILDYLLTQGVGSILGW